MSKFKIYKASAGSGKTYSLVFEYLKILIKDPEEYKHILAVTFTNDATEEMKTRVLTQLKLLAVDPMTSSYLEKLKKEVVENIPVIQKKAAEALQNILHDYSNFNISTIDTFFQKILRAFAKDIGVSAAYNLQLDHDPAVQEVTESVIANTTDQNKQSRWLMKAALEKIEDGKSWNIRKELKDLFKETFKENYQVKESRIRESFTNESQIEELQEQLKTQMISFENEIKNICSRCNQILGEFQLSRSSFSGKDRSFYGWVVKLESKDFDPPGNSFLKALDNVDTWYAKSAEPLVKESIVKAFNAGLNDELKKLHQYFTQHISVYETNRLIRQNLSYFVMLESLDQEMRLYKEENDVIFITDTNRFINEIIGDNDESFIFEKAGNHFHHYLIDEFQDTSLLQWNNFKPLISNAVSQGHTSLVVGDVKQSIYRFRNGDWRLLHEQAGKDIVTHEEIRLKENYRSLEQVIRFNNTFYYLAPGIISTIFSNDVKIINEWEGKFAECYKEQEQLIPDQNKDSGGFIKLNLFEKIKSEEETITIEEQQLNELQKDIENALSRGYRPNNIAILVFTKAEAYAVATHLRNYVEKNNLSDQINIVTQSALTISNAHTVRLVVAALQFLVDKKNEVSLANVFSEYEQYLAHQENIDFIDRRSGKMETFIQSIRLIQSLPLQILVDHIVRFFELEKETNEHIFLQHFKDAVFDYLKKYPDDLKSFLEWWEESSYKFQVEVPQNEKSLQIITIHKSKGLEFDLVFIPFADWQLDSLGLKADLMWLDVEGENFSKTLPVKYDKRMVNTIFAEEYLKNKFYNYLDRLNLLYVATTRAVRELYIYSERGALSTEADPRPSVKTILNHFFCSQMSNPSELYLPIQDFITESHSEITIGEKTQPAESTTKEDITSLEVSSRSSDIFESLAIKRNSLDLRDENLNKQEESKHIGILFHSIVADATTVEEALQFLHKSLLERSINKDQFEQFKKQIQTLFEQPMMKAFLKNFTSYAEYSFCNGDSILKPDKVFINNEEIVVIDFKTGKAVPEYIDQVQSYCKAANLLFNKPVRGYLYFTATNQFDQVV